MSISAYDNLNELEFLTVQQQDSLNLIVTPAPGQIAASLPGSDLALPGVQAGLNPILIIGGTVLVLGILGAPAKGAVSGRIGAADYSKYVIPVGIVIGAYFLLKNLNLGDLFGSSANKANNDATAASTAASLNSTQQQLAAQGIKPTLSAVQTNGIASQIFQLGLAGGGSPADLVTQDQIISSADSVNNLADWIAVEQAFGTRNISGSSWDSCSLIGINCQSVPLDAFLKLVLDSTHLNQLNQNFGFLNINYSIN